jgi:ABC-type multidrug transport system ATPase subunit
MDSIRLQCKEISKRYNRKIIFKNVNLELTENSSLVITGKNGSGKSTLLKVISHLIRLDKGSISLEINAKKIPAEKFYTKIGLFAPYLNLYDELSAWENLDFFYDLKVDKKEGKKEKIKYLLEKVGLYNRRDDLIRNYSSGMRQRLKLAYSVLNSPALLLMDEPRTNLDEQGISVVYEIAEEQKKNGILILATNEKEDTTICQSKLSIEDYK